MTSQGRRPKTQTSDSKYDVNAIEKDFIAFLQKYHEVVDSSITIVKKDEKPEDAPVDGFYTLFIKKSGTDKFPLVRTLGANINLQDIVAAFERVLAEMLSAAADEEKPPGIA